MSQEPIQPETASPQKEKRENPLLSILVNIAIPSIILMKFSGEDDLGPTWALLVALAFPFFYGVADFVNSRRFNFISALGVISILLTGGIGLLKLDPQWLAIKEAAVTLIIGLVVLGSMKTRYPLVKIMIYNDKVINVSKVDEALNNHGAHQAFERRLRHSSWMLAGSFFMSAILNYVLARMVVVSPAGTPAFNEELGKMTALSYPVIALPSMIMLFFALWFLISGIKKLTGLEWEDIFVH